MLTGTHVVVYSKDAEADRAFFRDKLDFRSVDAGHGWLIFAVPAAEVAFHPHDQNNKHEMFFTCGDLKVQVFALQKEVVRVAITPGLSAGESGKSQPPSIITLPALPAARGPTMHDPPRHSAPFHIAATLSLLRLS